MSKSWYSDFIYRDFNLATIIENIYNWCITQFFNSALLPWYNFNQVSHIDVPHGVTSLSTQIHTGIQSITLPDSLTKIGPNVFIRLL